MINLRNSHAGVGEIVGATNLDIVFFRSLLWPRKVLNVAWLGDGVVKGQVCYRLDVWVCNLAMITFVVVVGEGFPVVLARHAPDVIKFILGKVKMFESFLRVDTLKVVGPFHFRFRGRIQVDPDESNGIDMDMDRKEAMVLLVEIWDGVKARRLGKFSVYAVRPAMVLAREDLCVSRILCDNRKRSVPTDVVEAIDGCSILVQAQHERVASLLET